MIKTLLKNMMLTLMLIGQSLIGQDYLEIFPETSYNDNIYIDHKKENSTTVNHGDINIDIYSGDLSYNYQILKLLGPGGNSLEINLNYIQSLKHTTRNGSDIHHWQNEFPILPISMPGWLLSINGMAAQVFNFETHIMNSDIDNNDVGENNEISLLVDGYHYVKDIWSHFQQYHFLKGDGRMLMLINSNFEELYGQGILPSTGYLKPYLCNDKVKGFVSDQGDVYLYKNDGMIYKYIASQNVIWEDAGTSEPEMRKIWLLDQVVFPYSGYIQLEYDSNHPSGYGRPLLSRIIPNWDEESIVTFTYEFSGDRLINTRIMCGDNFESEHVLHFETYRYDETLPLISRIEYGLQNDPDYPIVSFNYEESIVRSYQNIHDNSDNGPDNIKFYFNNLTNIDSYPGGVNQFDYVDIDEQDSWGVTVLYDRDVLNPDVVALPDLINNYHLPKLRSNQPLQQKDPLFGDYVESHIHGNQNRTLTTTTYDYNFNRNYSYEGIFYHHPSNEISTILTTQSNLSDELVVKKYSFQTGCKRVSIFPDDIVILDTQFGEMEFLRGISTLNTINTDVEYFDQSIEGENTVPLWKKTIEWTEDIFSNSMLNEYRYYLSKLPKRHIILANDCQATTDFEYILGSDYSIIQYMKKDALGNIFLKNYSQKFPLSEWNPDAPPYQTNIPEIEIVWDSNSNEVKSIREWEYAIVDNEHQNSGQVCLIKDMVSIEENQLSDIPTLVEVFGSELPAKDVYLKTFIIPAHQTVEFLVSGLYSGSFIRINDELYLPHMYDTPWVIDVNAGDVITICVRNGIYLNDYDNNGYAQFTFYDAINDNWINSVETSYKYWTRTTTPDNPYMLETRIGNLIEKGYPNGNKEFYIYSWFDYYGQIENTVYGKELRTDGSSHIVQHFLNESNIGRFPIAISKKKSGGVYGQIQFYDYDEYGNTIFNLNENGYITRKDYDDTWLGISKIIKPYDFPINYQDTRGFTEKINYSSDGLEGIKKEVILKQDSDYLNDIIEEIYYDLYGRMFKHAYPSNETASIRHYNSFSNIVTEIDYVNNITSYEYDGLGRLTDINFTDDSQRRFEYSIESIIPEYPIEYTNVGELIIKQSYINETNKKVVQYIDVFNQLRQEEKYLGSSNDTYTLYNRTSYDYDASGNVIAIRHPDTSESTFGYDGLGNMLWSLNPDKGYTKYRYDKNGNLIFEQDAYRREQVDTGWVYHLYDELDRKIESGIAHISGEEEPGSNFQKTVKETYYYDEVESSNSTGKLTSILDHENMNYTRYHYDARGRIIHEDIYPEVNIVYQIAETVAEVAICLDDLGNPIQRSETIIISHDQTIVCTIEGLISGQTSAGITVNDEIIPIVNSHPVSKEVFAGDIIEMVVERFEEDTEVSASVVYEDVTNVVENIEGAAYCISHTYNSADKTTMITYPDGTEIEYVYNQLGQLESIPGYLDGLSGQGITYNPNGFLTHRYFANGAHYTYIPDVRNRIVMIDGSQTHNIDLKYEYYLDNNLKNEWRFVSGIFPPWEDVLLPFTIQSGGYVEETNEDIKNLMSMEENNPWSDENMIQVLTQLPEISILQSELLLVLSIDPTQRTKSTLESSLGSLTPTSVVLTNILANDEQSFYQEKAKEMLLKSPIIEEAELFIQKTYSIDSIDSVSAVSVLSSEEIRQNVKKQIVSLLGMKQAPPPESVDDQLITFFTETALLNTSARIQRISYWLKEADYTYDELHRLSTVSYSPMASPGSLLEFSYDIMGNRINKLFNQSETVYRYDVDKPNRLLGNNGPDGSTTDHEYDEIGNLIIDGESGYMYTYDWKNRLKTVSGTQFGEIVYTYNTHGHRIGKQVGNEKTHTIFNGDNPISEYDNDFELKYHYIYDSKGKIARCNSFGMKEFFHNDYLGSVRRISDGTGTLIWSRDYYPFGGTRTALGTNEQNTFTYEGKEKDLETDLWYNTSRYFNDEGRFTQIDPFWCKYPSISPYVRVANNPLRFVDRNGQEVGDWWDFYANYQRSYEIGEELLGSHKGHNDINDAMRHSTWQMRTTLETNSFTAWSSGIAHEIENLLQGGSLDETLMDLNNNAEGRDAANENREINPDNLDILDENTKDKIEYDGFQEKDDQDKNEDDPDEIQEHYIAFL